MHMPGLTDEELLARLVALDTTSHISNRAMADFICDYLAPAGVRIERFEEPGEDKVNLLLRCGPDGADGLLLCGHMDTVPADESDWESEPFALTQRGGRLYGRGTADMKSFVALAIQTLLRADSDGRLRKPLALLLTHDEEVGAVGAQRFRRAWSGREPLPRSVLIGEPTRLAAVRMHKGHLKLRITVRGKAAHSGLPHLGENAIERSLPVLQMLRDLAADWRSVRTPTSEVFPECPYPVLNLAMLRAGSAVNIVPDRTTLDVGIRLLPGQDSAVVLDELRNRFCKLDEPLRESVWLEVVNDNPPLLCDAGTPVYRHLCEILGQHETRGVSFASDAGVLAAMGLQCVLWGPGDMRSAHRANEYIEIEQLQIARAQLDAIVQRFCRE